MTHSVTIRPAVPGDVVAALELLRRCRLPLDGVAEWLGTNYVVARDADDVMVGVAGAEVYGSAGLLRSVAVADACRRRGLGQRLVENRIDWARRRGLTELYLLTTTAAGFFPRLGFAVVQRTSAPPSVQASPEFAMVCPSSAVAMRLSLSETSDRGD
jgi:amino-acid N-acetyltransferase